MFTCLHKQDFLVYEWYKNLEILKIKNVFKEDNAKIKLVLGVPNQSIPIWATQVLDE